MRIEAVIFHLESTVMPTDDQAGPAETAPGAEAVIRYFKAKGLGLAIADRIVAAHGGRVELVNLEPFGLEARVVLPIAG